MFDEFHNFLCGCVVFDRKPLALRLLKLAKSFYFVLNRQYVGIYISKILSLLNVHNECCKTDCPKQVRTYLKMNVFLRISMNIIKFKNMHEYS